MTIVVVMIVTHKRNYNDIHDINSSDSNYNNGERFHDDNNQIKKIQSL